MLSKYIYGSTFKRLCGACLGALLFFIITNFGVWLSGLYGYNIEGIIKCYVLAIPFFGYTLISTLLFSLLIETVYKYRNFYKKLAP
tara:strand:- start:240 stop:497 length:258 start_codon:yes stop_codon:yes gene_type:complete